MHDSDQPLPLRVVYLCHHLRSHPLSLPLASVKIGFTLDCPTFYIVCKAKNKHSNGQGRWLIKSAKFILDLLKNAESNVKVKGLDVDSLIVSHIQVNIVVHLYVLNACLKAFKISLVGVLKLMNVMAQLANTKVEVWSEKPFAEEISNLSARRDVRNAFAPTVKSFFDEISININMFSSIMLNWVVSNTNSSFIITKELQWSLTFLMKIKQDFLEPNFLTYFQTHSSIFGLNTASGKNTLLLTPPSYKIAPNRGTITRVKFSVNNRFCPIRNSGACINRLTVLTAKEISGRLNSIEVSAGRHPNIPVSVSRSRRPIFVYSNRKKDSDKSRLAVKALNCDN
uniref:Uncharacterized protein n=1 Tax=Cucumis melo TaxID=3656 RepID=A0A9I9EIL7_CUCME